MHGFGGTGHMVSSSEYGCTGSMVLSVRVHGFEGAGAQDMGTQFLNTHPLDDCSV